MKKTLIYGATGGIGEAVARQLNKNGDQLHLVARNAQRLETLANELDATYSVGDVQDVSLFENVAADCQGPLDGLVYAVGTINLKPFARFTAEEFMTDVQINGIGAALAVQSAVKSLKQSEGRGSVVLFSSVAAQTGFPMHASMGMAKGAVNGLMVSLAAELAPSVRVNAIAPSLTKTPLSESILSNEKIAKQIAELHPIKRLGTAEEVASLAHYLLSEQASWITGQLFAIDGGRSTLA